MKNRTRKHLGKPITNLDELIKDVEEQAKKILDNSRSDTYVGLMSSKVPVKKDGTFDGDRPDIIDMSNLHKFFDLIHNEADFNKEEVKTLTELMPLLVEVKKKYQDPTNFAIFLGERIGMIPKDREIDRYHKKIGDEKANVIESIEIAKSLLEMSLTMQDEEVKALVIIGLLQWSLHSLERARERLDFGGFDLDYDSVGTYTDKQLKEMEETFKRRDELPKDSHYRRDFVTQYIDNKVYNRFYYGKNDLKYTPELGREWDKHYNDLCDEYKETGYKRAFSDTHYNKTGERKGRDELLLCHYPLYPGGREQEQIEVIEIAQRHGIDSEIIQKGFKLQSEALGI